MVRTQIQLEERQYELLKRLAKEEGKSMAELIRMAVDYLDTHRGRGSQHAIRDRAKQAAGQFKSGLGDLSARHDDYFAETILP